MSIQLLLTNKNRTVELQKTIKTNVNHRFEFIICISPIFWSHVPNQFSTDLLL